MEHGNKYARARAHARTELGTSLDWFGNEYIAFVETPLRTIDSWTVSSHLVLVLFWTSWDAPFHPVSFFFLEREICVFWSALLHKVQDKVKAYYSEQGRERKRKKVYIEMRTS